MKKILFIAGTLGQGGAERQLFYLIDLLRHEYEIKVLSFTQGEFYEDKIKELGVEVEHIKRRKNKILKIKEVTKKSRKFKPDYIYSFHFYTNFYAALAAWTVYAVSIGSIRSDGYEEKKLNGIFSWLHYIFPDKIVANSYHGAQNVKKIFYKRKIIILPNLIDFDKFNCGFSTNKELILGFVGRMQYVKRPWLFIDLIKKLVEENIRVKGVMVGTGPLFDEIKLQSSKLPIDFIPSTTNIPKILSEISALIITSQKEGTPNVALEAIACRRPVLALRFSGIDFFEKEDLIYSFNNIDEMKEFIENKLQQIPIQVLEDRRNKLKKFFSKEAALKILKEEILI